MSRAVMQQMYQRLLTDPHSPKVCDGLEAMLREELAKPELMRMPKLGDRVVFAEGGIEGTVRLISPAGGPYIKFDDGTGGHWSLYEFGEMFHYADNTKEKT